jgi:putative AlgH/UPF0301 family transcriptional regulator
MSLRKLCFLVIVATAAACVVGGLNVQARRPDIPMHDARPYDPALASEASHWYTLQPANKPSQVKPFRAESESWPTALRRVQSKKAKDLGAGKLLVASRNLGDPNFVKTVVLLVHYDAEGVVGLILNRRSHVPLSRVLELKAAKDRSDPVYLGGPVETPTVFALLRSAAKPEGAEHVIGAVYMISTKTQFEQTISTRPDASVFHVYLGYAGWNIEQLRKEVEVGAWFIFPGDTETVFDLDPDSLWRQMIQKTEMKVAMENTANE